jgi:DUF1680 family protein
MAAPRDTEPPVSPTSDYPITPVAFTAVKVRDGFWTPRLETNRKVTIPSNFKKCQETGRIDNFAKAGKLMPGEFEGIAFNDSDVYKVIEGAAYSLALTPDPALAEYLDRLIVLIAAAQEPDGYLYTCRTIDPQTTDRRAGPMRWLNEMGAQTGDDSHELYNVGHLYEAAVAHYQATGKRTLLDVALRSADLIASVWGPRGLHIPPGHQEIEIGLIKLYRVTGERKYLELAKFLLDQRGRGGSIALSDHLPVWLQREAMGHAVRSAYMYAAMADIAALTGDQPYLTAVSALWESVVGKKIYLTGGIGARPAGEMFGSDYELPNKTGYNETCAAIANCLWNHRMFLLYGDAQYMDVFERTLYNGFLAGVSLGGDHFFYPNPLESDGVYPFNHGATGRQAWFETSCCPVNVVRFLPEIAGCIYAVRENVVYVNLYIGSETALEIPAGPVRLAQTHDYPWSGHVLVTVDPLRSATFSLCLRIPGWARGEVVPSDLYRYADSAEAGFTFKLNGAAVAVSPKQGYAVFERLWSPGDRIEIDFAMPVRRVRAREAVQEDAGRLALERGPLVYCVEAVDHEGDIQGLGLDDASVLESAWLPDLLGGTNVIRGRAERKGVEIPFQAVPYHLWNHRGDGPMSVWVHET